MILKQGHKYEPMPHDGKVIRRIYRGGRCYYKDSPYSLAATQALNAAFPQYWTAIRDYGVAHPALVPFINEDPMLIVSLVEVGKTRYCESSGMAYFFVNGVYGSDKLVTESKFAYLAGYTYPAVFGCASSGETNRYTIHSNPEGTNVHFRITGLRVDSATNPEAWNEVKISKDGCYCNGELLGKFTSTFKVTNNMGVFLEHQDTIQTTRFANARIEYLKFTDEDISVHLCPFTRNGKNGMLDILSGTFYPNANTQGAFTIQVTDKA